MQQSYLEVTFRGGQPLAAYYYLPRARTTGASASKNTVQV
jgi:hypothetical protein